MKMVEAVYLVRNLCGGPEKGLFRKSWKIKSSIFQTFALFLMLLFLSSLSSAVSGSPSLIRRIYSDFYKERFWQQSKTILFGFPFQKTQSAKAI